MIRRIVAMSVALTFVSFAAAQADDPGGEDIVVPAPAVVVEDEPVMAVSGGPDYARNGVYVGVAGTYAFQNFQNGHSDAGDSLGLNARVGYRLHPRVSAELEFEWLEGFSSDDRNTDIEAWALTANAKGYLTTGQIQPFLLAGLGVMQADAERSTIVRGASPAEAFVARLGGGVDVYATENFAISVGADYVLPTNALKDMDYVAVQWGFLYRF
jgi:hypothetical protein